MICHCRPILRHLYDTFILTGERCIACDYDLCGVCSKAVNLPNSTPVPALSEPVIVVPSVNDMSQTTLAPPPTLQPPAMLQPGSDSDPTLPAHPLNLFPIFNMAPSVRATVAAPSPKLFPLFMRPPTPHPLPLQPEYVPKFFQNVHDPWLLTLPAWKPMDRPPLPPIGSRMRRPGVRRSLTPHVLQALPYYDSSGIVEQCD